MSLLSIVIPTIDGREASLKRTVDAYEDSLRMEAPTYEIIVIRNLPNWPTACNEGALQVDGDVLHFGADDLVPLPGWYEDAMYVAQFKHELPAPVVFNYTHSPDAWDNSADGPDGALTHFTRVPLMTREQYDLIGPWPDMDYAADVWLSERARTLGIETRMVHSYAFVHHWEQHGRIDTPDRLAASDRRLNELRAAGLKAEL